MQTMILDYYPPVIRRIREVRQIAAAEDAEFAKLDAAMAAALDNMFVPMADEAGTGRFESLLGIKPKVGQGLDDRKANVLAAMNRGRTGLSGLERILSVSGGGVRLENDTPGMGMTVETGAGGADVRTMRGILDEALPLNIHIRFVTRMGGKAGPKILHLQRAGAALRVRPLPQE